MSYLNGHFFNKQQTQTIMIELLGSCYDQDTEIFTFYYWNRDTNWYYSMACRNSSGTMDMHQRCPYMDDNIFGRVAQDRIA